MNDCCSPGSSATCLALSICCFILFVAAFVISYYALRSKKELRREVSVVALYSSICLCLISRGFYFLNNYFAHKNHCLYMTSQYLPVAFLTVGVLIFSCYLWYMSECTNVSYEMLEVRLRNKKHKFNVLTLITCSVGLCVVIICLLLDCQSEDHRERTSDFIMALFFVLALIVFLAGLKLLVNLKKDFTRLYAAIRCKVFAITLGGTLAMLFRAMLSFTDILAPRAFDRFKEQSLLNNTASFPIFQVSFLMFSEILPITCFMIFLASSSAATGENFTLPGEELLGSSSSSEKTPEDYSIIKQKELAMTETLEKPTDSYQWNASGSFSEFKHDTQGTGSRIKERSPTYSRSLQQTGSKRLTEFA